MKRTSKSSGFAHRCMRIQLLNPLLKMLGFTPGHRKNNIIGLCFAILFFSINCDASIIYVKQNAGGNGISWANAYGSLQSALNAAANGDQVWVGQGTYYPTTTSSQDSSFYLKNGVAVYGGFVGTETLLSQRADTSGIRTILSGNLGNGNHSKHIVYGLGTLDSTSILNGFTISGAVLNLTGTDVIGGGAGMYNEGSPSLSNIIFRSNSLTIYANIVDVPFGGGAGMCTKFGNPVLKNIVFNNNTVNYNGTVSMTVAGGGGGLYVDSGNVQVINVRFDSNSAYGYSGFGGGLFTTGTGTTTVINALFTHNAAATGSNGIQGAALCISEANATVTNATFCNNYDNALWEGYTISNYYGTLVMQNCIVHCSYPNIYNIFNTGTLTTNYCYLNGTYAGTGNINSSAYPLFADTTHGNYSLMPCSPALNAGYNAYNTVATDLGGKPRIYGAIDMGAFEYQRPAVMPDTVYVNHNSTDPDPDGTSWTKAFQDLQTAMQYVCGSSYPKQIWVAAGTYKPTIYGDQTATFQLNNGQSVYGGFAGNETALYDRDTTGNTNTTILSGEIQGDNNPYNNSFHVVYANTDSTTQLNGFTITGGCGNGGQNTANISGGGILNVEGNTTFANLIIKNNQAEYGGGIANYNGSPLLTHVLFVNDTGSFGAGMYNDGEQSLYGLLGATPYSLGATPILTNDSFVSNFANDLGGGCDNYTANSIFEKVVFLNNGAGYYGGGMETDNCSAILTHVKFIGNRAIDTASSQGGAMYCDAISPLVNIALNDVLFAKNYDGISGGAIYFEMTSGSALLNNVTFSGNKNLGNSSPGNSIYINSGNIKFRNSIVDSADNSNSSFGGSTGQCIIRSSLFSGSFPFGAIDSGNNLLIKDPLFVDTANADYSLQICSPAINVGNNNLLGTTAADLADNPRIYNAINGGIVDLGAYEYQGAVSPLPVSTLGIIGNLVFCQGDSVILNAPSGIGYNYQWQLNGTNIPNDTLQALHIFASGSYSVTTTNINNCITASAPDSIIVYPLPNSVVAASGPASFCTGDSITISATASPGLSYQWEKNGISISNDTLSQITVNASGIYIVSIKNNNCTDTSTGVNVVVHPLLIPLITISGTLLSTTTFTVYEWYENGIAITGATGQSLNITHNGAYSVMVTDSNGCSGMSAIDTIMNVDVVNVTTGKKEIEVYPNPANSILHIDADVNVDIRILGLDGKIMLTQNEAKEINISQLPDAVYIVRLTNVNGMLLKVIKIFKVDY